MRSAAQGAGSGLAPAPQPNSSASTAAQAAQEVWLDDLQRLANQVKEYADSLTASARQYRTTDDDVRALVTLVREAGRALAAA